MFCRKCGSEISDDSLFCVKCGEKIHKESIPISVNAISSESEQVTPSASDIPGALKSRIFFLFKFSGRISRKTFIKYSLDITAIQISLGCILVVQPDSRALTWRASYAGCRNSSYFYPYLFFHNDVFQLTGKLLYGRG